ncbi:MAG: fructose-6-phosphate aldolase [Bacillota bacterium]
MKLFIDTANIEEIREAASWGVISGVTTNPSLIAREGRDFHQVVAEITQIVPGPVSAEVLADDANGMVKEAETLAEIDENVVIKLPMTTEGLKAASQLRKMGIRTNVTLVFSPAQALLAALSGATYVSPFVGRLDDVGSDGLQVVRDSVAIFETHQLQTRIIAASIRHPMHVVEAALAGAHIATVPYSVLLQMFRHPLTDTGIQRFKKDWASVFVKQ